MDKRTFVIVDGHAGVRAALAQRLAQVPGVSVVGTAGALGTAIRLVQQCAPDVVLCDPRSLEGDGLTALRALAALGQPIVVLTTALREGDAEAYARSAAAVLLKGAPLPEILQALEAVRVAPHGTNASPTTRRQSDV